MFKLYVYSTITWSGKIGFKFWKGYGNFYLKILCGKSSIAPIAATHARACARTHIHTHPCTRAEEIHGSRRILQFCYSRALTATNFCRKYFLTRRACPQLFPEIKRNTSATRTRRRSVQDGFCGTTLQGIWCPCWCKRQGWGGKKEQREETREVN